MKHFAGPVFSALNVLGMILILTCCEYNHRRVMASEIEWQVKKQPSVSKSEFHRAIKCGQ